MKPSISFALIAAFMVGLHETLAVPVRPNAPQQIRDNDDDMDNKLFSYELVHSNNKRSNQARSNLVPLHSFDDSQASVLPSSSSASPIPVSSKNLSPEEQTRLISMNSREVRLTEPNGREVEMKDDMATKLMVIYDNFQKETSVFLDQVNTQLDKGWRELKAMVEEATSPKKNQSRNIRQASGRDSLVVPSSLDGYSMAGEEESASAKVKEFFSNIGLNEDNKKKASEALSKAGSQVSETMTKDLPDALKKAGNVVSETFTNDLPNAFKNIFG